MALRAALGGLRRGVGAGARQIRTTTPACGILKGLSPVLTPDLLWALRAAGHGTLRQHLLSSTLVFVCA